MAKFRGAILTCGECGGKFKVPPGREATAKYCSKDCADIHRQDTTKKAKLFKVCPVCEREYEVYPCHKKRRKFCSYECKDKYAAYSVPVERHFYNRTFWDELRKMVVKRDGHTCQHCGLHGKGLHAHHIISKFLGGEDELSNLITLCNSCHRKAHR